MKEQREDIDNFFKDHILLLQSPIAHYSNDEWHGWSGGVILKIILFKFSYWKYFFYHWNLKFPLFYNVRVCFFKVLAENDYGCTKMIKSK